MQNATILCHHKACQFQDTNEGSGLVEKAAEKHGHPPCRIVNIPECNQAKLRKTRLSPARQ
jgi:hypothetical protein